MWRKLEIGAHQDEAVGAIDNQNKSDVLLDGFPKEIEAVESDGFGFAVDRELRFLEHFGKVKNVLKSDFILFVELFAAVWPIELADIVAFGASNDMDPLAPVLVEGGLQE